MAEDARRDQRIDALRDKFEHLSQEHKQVANAVAALLEIHPEVGIDGINGTNVQS